ncbi:Tyrosine-protein kinase Abl [Aphelenchoides besseyi]|nr:Tyrosine-protein kinase Abl [Aphelenchoides besseyi]
MSVANGFPTSTMDDAKMPLLRGRSDGTFLIRNSTNFPDGFTLCVAYNAKVEHYRIYLTEHRQYTCDHEEMFDNLIQLVSHYKRDADGLCHRLVTPQVSEAFRLQYESANREERCREFQRAGAIVPRNEVQLGDVIGHGEFGDVLLGMYRGRKVAVKTPKNGLSSDLLNESRIMIDLRHTNLVALVGVVIDDNHDVFMLIEYMANGNLVEFLRSRGRHQVEKDQLLGFAINVADGMSYMESIQLVHRDLAARNVLLDANFNAKISDFGLAQKVGQPALDKGRARLPIKWSSPEALRDGPIQDVVRHVEKGYRMEMPEGCAPLVNELMCECWALEPRARPTFSELVNKLKRISSFLLSN